MLSLLLVCLVLATVVGQSPQDLKVIAGQSYEEIEATVADPVRLNAIVDCIVEVGDCSDPLATPLFRAVRAWVASKEICSFCKEDERQKVQFIISQLQIKHDKQYNRIIQHYNFQP